MQQSKFVKYHVPCPQCESHDAVSVNEDGSAKCFSCDSFFPKYSTGVQSMDKPIPKIDKPLNAHGGIFARLTDRNISKETAEKYGVKVIYDGAGQLAQHHYPFYINHEQCATKIRYIRDKRFSFEGTIQGSGLFGQNLFKEGGKYLTIVEGECAAKAVATIIRPGKAKIVTLPNGYKDPNDMLNKGRHSDFTRAWWDAQVYTPSGIIRVADKQKDFLDRTETASVPYPWAGLNKKLLGLRAGELVTLTGGTGLGKSSVTRELEHWLINNTKDNVGVIALEEDWKRTVDGILSIEANDHLHIDTVRKNYSTEHLGTMFNKVFGSDRVFIHAHFGANDIEAIFAKLRYLIVGCDCKWVVVDHLHMLVSSMIDGDERKAIDSIMTRLRSMVEETGAGIILVSHLRRVEGNKGHENGVTVSLSHLRGSNSIAQLSDCVIALERNQQSDDELESRTTNLRVLKSRYTGNVGNATSLVYNQETGRLTEYEDVELLHHKTAEDKCPF